MESPITQTLSVSLATLGVWTAVRLRAGASRPHYLTPENDQALLRAVARTLEGADSAYLRRRSAETRDLRRFMRFSRKAFLRAYLDHMRAGFVESSRLVRQFAADTDAPDLAFLVLRQSIRFHALWWTLRLSLICNLMGPAWQLVEKLSTAAQLRTAPSGADETSTAQS